jgi:hypothetical protein
MASRGLCSLGESLGDSELTSEAARLLFAEEPTEPDLRRASIEAARHHVRSTTAVERHADIEQLHVGGSQLIRVNCTCFPTGKLSTSRCSAS